MPYCNQCGTFVVDDDRFCPKCGRPQHPESAPASAAGAPVAPDDRAAEPAPVASPGEPPASSAPSGSPPPPPPVTPAPGAATGQPLTPNVAAMLCYIPVVGWVAAVILLTLDSYRRDRYVRFHAFQGLFLAVIFLLVDKFFFPFHFGDVRVFPFPFIGFRKLCILAVTAAQVVGIIKTVQNQEYRLPVLSDLAEKSLA